MSNLLKLLLAFLFIVSLYIIKTTLHLEIPDLQNRIEKRSCRLPQLDPFDPEVLPFIRKVDLKCEDISFSDVQKNKLIVDPAKCQKVMCQNVTFREGDSFQDSEKFDCQNGFEVLSDILLVECMDEGKPSDKYHKMNWHTTIVKKSDVTKRKETVTTDRSKERLDIFFIGLESTSRSNFIRMLPKSLEYLQTNLNKSGNVLDLQGYSVVADGTTGNLAALLTGKSLLDLPDASIESRESDYVDKWPWLWNELKNLGYATSFSEDMWWIGAFSRRLKGFNAQPTDHYFNPFWKSIGVYQNSSSCVTGEWNIQRHLKLVEQLIESYPDTPKFSFTFTKLGHDDPNRLEVCDDQLYDFLVRMSNSKSFNNAITFIFGDHGSRFGELRQTFTGSYEEFMPAGYLILPEWFPTKYPELTKNLHQNQFELTTPFDIWATLKHLINMPNTPVLESHQASLFTPLKKGRHCIEAGVPDHFCVCHEWANKKPDRTTQKGITILLDSINKKIQEEFPNKCSRLQLGKIIESYQSVHNGNHPITVNQFKVKMLMLPGVFTLEGSFKEFQNGTIVPSPDISRLDSYGDQKCNPPPSIQPFCVCI